MTKDRNPDGTFAAGNTISKGRQTGSRNAITQDMLNRLVKKFEADDTNPVEGMYALLNDENANAELKFRIFSKLMDYTNNQALNTTDDDGNAQMNESDIDAQIAEMQRKLEASDGQN